MAEQHEMYRGFRLEVASDPHGVVVKKHTQVRAEPFDWDGWRGNFEHPGEAKAWVDGYLKAKREAADPSVKPYGR